MTFAADCMIFVISLQELSLFGDLFISNYIEKLGYKGLENCPTCVSNVQSWNFGGKILQGRFCLRYHFFHNLKVQNAKF